MKKHSTPIFCHQRTLIAVLVLLFVAFPIHAQRVINRTATICRGETGWTDPWMDTLFYEDFESGDISCWDSDKSVNGSGFQVGTQLHLRGNASDPDPDHHRSAYQGHSAFDWDLDFVPYAFYTTFTEAQKLAYFSLFYTPNIPLFDPSQTVIQFMVYNEEYTDYVYGQQTYDEVGLIQRFTDGQTSQKLWNDNCNNCIRQWYSCYPWEQLSFQTVGNGPTTTYFQFAHLTEGGVAMGIDNVLVYGPRATEIPAWVSNSAPGTYITDDTVYRIGCEWQIIRTTWTVTDCSTPPPPSSATIIHRNDTICAGETGGVASTKVINDTLLIERFENGIPECWKSYTGTNVNGFSSATLMRCRTIAGAGFAGSSGVSIMPYNGSRSAFEADRDFYYGAGNPQSELVTPGVQIIDPANTWISFGVIVQGLVNLSTNEQYVDEGGLAFGSTANASALDGYIWQTPTGQGGYGGAVWHPLQFSLSSLPVGVNYFHFLHVNNGGLGMGLDDVLVYGPRTIRIPQNVASASAGTTGLVSYDTLYSGSCMRITATHWTILNCTTDAQNDTIHIYDTICVGETGYHIGPVDTLFYETFDGAESTCFGTVDGPGTNGIRILHQMNLRSFEGTGVVPQGVPMSMAAQYGYKAAFEAVRQTYTGGAYPVSQLITPLIDIVDPANTAIAFDLILPGFIVEGNTYLDSIGLVYGNDFSASYVYPPYLWSGDSRGHGSWTNHIVPLASMPAGQHSFHFLHGNYSGYGMGLDNIIIVGPRRITIPAQVSAAAGNTDMVTTEEVYRNNGCQKSVMMVHWHINRCTDPEHTPRSIHRNDTVCQGETGYHIMPSDTLYYENFNTGNLSCWELSTGLNGSGFQARNRMYVFNDPSMPINAYEGNSLMENTLDLWPPEVDAVSSDPAATSILRQYRSSATSPIIDIVDPSNTFISLWLHHDYNEIYGDYRYVDGSEFVDELLGGAFNCDADGSNPRNAAELFHFNADGLDFFYSENWEYLYDNSIPGLQSGPARLRFQHINSGGTGMGLDEILLIGPRRINIPTQVSSADGNADIVTYELVQRIGCSVPDTIWTHWHVDPCLGEVIERWDTICPGETGYHIGPVDTLFYENFEGRSFDCWDFTTGLNGSGFQVRNRMNVFDDPSMPINAYRGRSLMENTLDLWPPEVDAVSSDPAATPILRQYRSSATSPIIDIVDPANTFISLWLYHDYNEIYGDYRYADGSQFVDELLGGAFNCDANGSNPRNAAELFHFNAVGLDYFYSENWEYLYDNSISGIQPGWTRLRFQHINSGATGMGLDEILILGPRRHYIPAQVSAAPRGSDIDASEQVYRKGCKQATIITHWHVKSSVDDHIVVDTVACDTLRWRGRLYTASIVDTIDSIIYNGTNRCSDVVLNLTMAQSSWGEQTSYICNPTPWAGKTYSTTVTDTVVFKTTVANCDSVVVAHFVRYYGDTTWIDTSICTGESYLFHFNNYTSDRNGLYLDSTLVMPLWSGTTTFYDTTPYLHTVKGCDSMAYLTLHINRTYENPMLTDTISQSQLPYTGFNYISGQDYYYELRNEHIPITSSLGCDSSYYLTLVILYELDECDENLQFPNLVTPNGDGKNDVFNVVGIDNGCWPINELRIYNRWGILVYKAKNLQEGEAWDPKHSPEGTYFYRFQARNAYGNIERSGAIEVIKD